MVFNIVQLVEEEENISQNDFVIDRSFSDRLLKLQVDAMRNQYYLACLSTLGGAYHLCNNPRTAMVIARRQEYIGWKLNSTAIVIKSRVFQAINMGLLGNLQLADNIFKECSRRAKYSSDPTEQLSFISASKMWLKRKIASDLMIVNIQCSQAIN